MCHLCKHCILYLFFLVSSLSVSSQIVHTHLDFLTGRSDQHGISLSRAGSGCDYIGYFQYLDMIKSFEIHCQPDSFPAMSIVTRPYFKPNAAPRFDIPALTSSGKTWIATSKWPWSPNSQPALMKLGDTSVLARIPLYDSVSSSTLLNAFRMEDTLFYIVKDSANPENVTLYRLFHDSLATKWHWQVTEPVAAAPVYGTADTLVTLTNNGLYLVWNNGKKLLDSIHSNENVRLYHNAFGNFAAWFNKSKSALVLLKIDRNHTITKTEHTIHQAQNYIKDLWISSVDGHDFILNIDLATGQSYSSYLMHFSPWGELVQSKFHEGTIQEYSKAMHVPFIHNITRLDNGTHLMLQLHNSTWKSTLGHTTIYPSQSVLHISYGNLANMFDKFYTMQNQNLEQQNSIEILGNPAAESLKILYHEKRMANIQIYNSLGQVQLKTMLHPGLNELDISKFTTGIYLLKTENHAKTWRVVVMH